MCHIILIYISFSGLIVRFVFDYIPNELEETSWKKGFISLLAVVAQAFQLWNLFSPADSDIDNPAQRTTETNKKYIKLLRFLLAFLETASDLGLIALDVMAIDSLVSYKKLAMCLFSFLISLGQKTLFKLSSDSESSDETAAEQTNLV